MRPPRATPRPFFASALALAGAAAAGVCGALFLALAGGVFAGAVDRVDGRALLWVAAHRRPPLTSFLTWVTALGAPEVLWILAAGISGALVLARHPGMALALAASLLGGTAIGAAIKAAIARARPELVPHLVGAGGYAFPSGHVINSITFFVTAALLVAGHVRGRALRLFLVAYALAIALLVAVSRVYLGVHNPSDVVGGALVAVPWSIAVVLAERMWRHARRQPGAPRPTSRTSSSA